MLQNNCTLDAVQDSTKHSENIKFSRNDNDITFSTYLQRDSENCSSRASGLIADKIHFHASRIVKISALEHWTRFVNASVPINAPNCIIKSRTLRRKKLAGEFYKRSERWHSINTWCHIRWVINGKEKTYISWTKGKKYTCTGWSRQTVLQTVFYEIENMNLKFCDAKRLTFWSIRGTNSKRKSFSL